MRIASDNHQIRELPSYQFNPPLPPLKTNKRSETTMSGLGGLNKSSSDSITIGFCQSQPLRVLTPTDLHAATQHVCALVAKARTSYPLMDLVVFPEYCIHGLSMSTDDAIMCTLDGPEVQAFRGACVENAIWGCFSIMERNALGMPWNTGVVIDDKGRVVN